MMHKRTSARHVVLMALRVAAFWSTNRKAVTLYRSLAAFYESQSEQTFIDGDGI